MEHAGKGYDRLWSSLAVAVAAGLLLVGCDALTPRRPSPAASSAPSATGALLATAGPPTATAAPATATPEPGWEFLTAKALPVTLRHPAGWVVTEEEAQVLVAADAATVAGAEVEGSALLLRQVEGAASAEALLAPMEGGAGEVIRREEATLAGRPGRLLEVRVVSPSTGRGYRLVAVATVSDGQGYLAVATAPLEQWEAAWPLLEETLASVAAR
ncbi:MAG: photosystem II reaction center PsbP family protein [Anaerolineae bacterium]|nr:photosystem II reaction center PsbP family protein [Anaerolineae bacterium]